MQPGAEKDAQYYDTLFSERAHYNVHYTDVHYYVQWVQVERFLRPFKNRPILEIGCGPGQLAQMLQDLGYTDYTGFDFSEVAVAKATDAVTFPIFQGDALDPKTYDRPYDAVICLEVLEHLKDDHKVLENIRLGSTVIVSVPNFDDASHVRWFRSQYQVRSRYYRHIAIERICFINDIYIVYGTRSDFKPNLVQRLLKTRDAVGVDGFMLRIKHKLNHLLKIKHR
jgi:SAM-dependent methyltransferase